MTEPTLPARAAAIYRGWPRWAQITVPILVVLVVLGLIYDSLVPSKKVVVQKTPTSTAAAALTSLPMTRLTSTIFWS